MEPATPPLPGFASPLPKPRPDVIVAWPRSAQLATVCLAGVAIGLLALHGYRSSRWSTRPAELDRTTGLTYRIDLNRADRAELLQLPGVGPSLAQKIETYRREHGHFRSVNDLAEIEGVGPKTLERLRPLVQVKFELARNDDEDAELESESVPNAKRKSISKRSAPSETVHKKPVPDRPLDLNLAGAEELKNHLDGVGLKLAQRIVEARKKQRFRSIEELRQVNGVTQKILDANRSIITVDDSNPPQHEPNHKVVSNQLQ